MIILGARFPALGVIASLAPKGIECVVCDSRRLQAAWSRYAKFRRLPDPRVDEVASLTRLIETAYEFGQSSLPVIIPTDDHFVRLIARHRSELEGVAILCAAPTAAVELITSQLDFCNWARGHGIDAPRSISGTARTLPFDYPMVIKPINFSQFLGTADQLPTGTRPSDLRFTLIKNEREWCDFQRRYAAILEQFVIQEFIGGTSADMYSLGLYADRKSQVRGLFVGRKVRGFPAQYGNTIVGQNDCVPDGVLEQVNSIVEKLGYCGIAEFEYRLDPTSGTFRLIEINPRCWSWILATTYSPADIVEIAYRDLIGEDVGLVIDNAKPGTIKVARVMPDLVNVFWRYRSDEPNWLLSPRQWWQSLRAEKRGFVEFQRWDVLVSLYCAALTVRDAITNER